MTTKALFMETVHLYVAKRLALHQIAPNTGKRITSLLRIFATRLECDDANCAEDCAKKKILEDRLHVGNTLGLDIINDVDITRYLILTDLGYDGRQQFQSVLRTFTAWLMKNNYRGFGENPADGIELEKKPERTQAPFLGAKQLGKALKAAAEFHVQDYFLILIVWLSGRRIGEIKKLRVGDVDTEDKVIHWTDHKNKENNLEMDLHLLLAIAVKEWLKEYERLMGPLQDNWYLFPSRKPVGPAVGAGQRRAMALDPEDFMHSPWARMTLILKEAGIYIKGKNFHSLRRGFGDGVVEAAWEMGMEHVGMSAAQAALNHSDVRTTEQFYARPQARRVAKKVLGQIGHRLLPDEVLLEIPIFAHLPGSEVEQPASVPMAKVIQLFGHRTG